MTRPQQNPGSIPPPADVIDLQDIRTDVIGDADAPCTRCGCLWWQPRGVTIGGGLVTALAYPIVCVNCGHRVEVP